MGEFVKQGLINGKEYAGYVTPLGNQFMASVVSAGELIEREHYTKLCDSEEHAIEELNSLWNELENKLAK